MVTRSVPKFLFWVWLTCNVSEIYAETLSLLILDENQQPLENAVVEISSPPPTPAPDTPVIVDQVDKQFLPTVQTIRVGQYVSFPNSDDIRHHVYSFSPAKPFELKLYAGKPEKPLLFEVPGVVVLGCNIHDSMVGYVYVSQGTPLLTNANGLVHLATESLPSKIYVWHANQLKGPEHRELFYLDSIEPAGSDQPNTKVVHLKTQDPQPRNTFKARFRSSKTP